MAWFSERYVNRRWLNERWFNSADYELGTGKWADDRYLSERWFTARWISRADSGAVQSVTGSGAFATPDLAVPFHSSVGTTSQVALGTGNFVAGTITVVSAGVALSQQFVYNAGGQVDLPPIDMTAVMAGVGSVAQDVATGSGAFQVTLATPTQAGAGQKEQEASATGAFATGDLSVTQASAGDVLPAGSSAGFGSLQLGISVTQAAAGTSSDPQQVAGGGVLLSSTIEATMSGTGAAVFATVGTGAGVAGSVSASMSASGTVAPPPPVDLGWESDDITWGGTELSSKSFVPVYISSSGFKILGYNPTVPLDVYAQRSAVVSERGASLLGREVWPDIDGPAGEIIQISLGGHDTPEGGIDWEGPYDFVIGEDYYVDFAVEGKYLAIRFESTGVAVWTLQSYDIEYEIIGMH